MADYDLSSASIGQASINVRDVEKAVAFYRDSLGMRFLFQAGPKMAFFDCGGVRLYLACGEGADPQGASSYLYWRGPLRANPADVRNGCDEVRLAERHRCSWRVPEEAWKNRVSRLSDPVAWQPT